MTPIFPMLHVPGTFLVWPLRPLTRMESGSTLSFHQDMAPTGAEAENDPSPKQRNAVEPLACLEQQEQEPTEYSAVALGVRSLSCMDISIIPRKP